MTFAARRQALASMRQMAQRRFASSASTTEQQAKQAANQVEKQVAGATKQAEKQVKDVANQAEQQTRQAMEQAQQYADRAMAGAKRVAGPFADRIGGMLGGYREPLVYNFQVFTSLCRQVYVAEKLAPPTSLATWAGAYARIWSRASSPQWWREVASSGQWVQLGIYVSPSPAFVSKGYKRMFLMISYGFVLAGPRGIRYLQDRRDHRQAEPRRLQAQGEPRRAGRALKATRWG